MTGMHLVVSAWSHTHTLTHTHAVTHTPQLQKDYHVISQNKVETVTKRSRTLVNT